jgi:VIT1/CCC1 family predicted Fe2+/Mn2+ transporter
MKTSLLKGLSFGLTSGVITTLGMLVGVSSSTHLPSAVIGAIIAIAVADAMSDAFGIHVSEESENRHTDKEVWESTFATLVSKFLFAITFVVPFLLLDLNTAVLVDILWGMLLITVTSVGIADLQDKRRYRVVGEHLAITLLVVGITYIVGTWISNFI